MTPSRLYVSRLIFRFLPETGCFQLKAALLRWSGVQVGKNIRFCSSAAVHGRGELVIGDETWIGHQVLIVCNSRVQIGSCVDIGPRASIGTGTHEVDASGPHSAGKGISGDVSIGDGTWVCSAVVILPGVSVGSKAVLAAGAVVTKDVAEKTIVGGVPARFIKNVEDKWCA